MKLLHQISHLFDTNMMNNLAMFALALAIILSNKTIQELRRRVSELETQAIRLQAQVQHLGPTVSDENIVP